MALLPPHGALTLAQGTAVVVRIASPELVLNCVRATAKLSCWNYAQLNQEQANLHHVSALVGAEDDRAYAARWAAAAMAHGLSGTPGSS